MRCRVGTTSPLLVLFFVALHAAAIFLFLNGFFLTRYEIQTRSQCTQRPSSSTSSSSLSEDGLAYRRSSRDVAEEMVISQQHHDAPGTGVPSHERSCWMPRRFKRALFVIVDALRFDFTLYTRPRSPSAAQGASVAGAADIDASMDLQDDYYVNNLPVINHLLLNNASNTLLFRFVADAPTTTLQRLKALNTGGIPTFLEAKNNFDSSELSEDNLIRQLRDNGRGAVFMGDDTWAKLFPPHKRYFTRSHPFPSFNVKDLHTVDDGVMRHLFPEMRNEPAAEGEEGWEVIVAHFLGVDHAGHRFGPSHPQMRQKLRQMNGILQQIVEAMEEDTILFVMGDHGMTADGNHGGHTESEVTAALFVYTPSKTFNRWDQLHLGEDIKDVFTGSELGEELKDALLRERATGAPAAAKQTIRSDGVVLTKDHFRQLSQIDVVPTIALLLGLPIPFGNLGGVIPELFLGIAPPAYYGFERDDMEQLRRKGDKAGHGDDEDDPVLDSEEGLFFEYLERKWGAKAHLYDHDEGGEDGPSLASLQQWLDGYERLNAAMEVNSLQIDAYLSAYADVSPSFPSREVDSLRRHLTRANTMLRALSGPSSSSAESDGDDGAATTSAVAAGRRAAMAERVRQHHRIFKHYHRFQKQVGDICRRLWATFDVESMTWGLALLFSSIGGLVCVILAPSRAGGHSAMATASFDFSFALAGGAVGAVLAFCFVADAFRNIPALVGTTLICSVIGFAFVPFFFSFFFFTVSASASASSFSMSWRPSLRALASRLAERRRADVLSAVAVALFALHGVGLFSNSFIEAEHQVISFLLTSLLLCYLAAAWRRRHHHHYDHRKRHPRPAAAEGAGAQYGDVVKLVMLLCIIRFSPSIVGRHESVAGDTAPGGLQDEEDAFPPPIVEPMEASQVRAVSPESGELVWQGVQFFFSAQFAWDTLVPLAIMLFTFAFALRRFFCLSSSPSSSSSSSSRPSLLPAGALLALHAASLLCSAVYWTFQRLALLDHFIYLWKILFPRLVYAASLASLALLLALLHRRRRRRHPPGPMVASAPELQGTFMVLGMVVCVPVMLVFGPGSCWTFVSFLCAPLLFVDVSARMKAADDAAEVVVEEEGDDIKGDHDDHTAKAGNVDRAGAVRQRVKTSAAVGDHMVDIPRPEARRGMLPGRRQPSLDVSEVIVWVFFAVLLFYKSGHLCDFSSLQFEAPFIGFEEMNMIVGAVLMVLNTFGCYFLFVLFLPLLLFWSNDNDDTRRVERRFTREEVRAWTLRAVWLFMLAFVVKLFLTTLFVFLVRRHLMVWKVFAPKYVFDASATAIVDLLLVLLYLFVYVFI